MTHEDLIKKFGDPEFRKEQELQVNEYDAFIERMEKELTIEELKARISYELKSKADKHGYVVIPDHFGIGGYMCEVNRIEKFLFPIIDKVLKSND